MKSSNPVIRRCHRVIRMVSELHRQGFQLLRISPFEKHGCWRLLIGARKCFAQQNGAVIAEFSEESTSYLEEQGDRYFEWDDARGNSAREMADKFLQRFPELGRICRERDWEYAGWLGELVGFLEQGDYLPYVEHPSVKLKRYSLTDLPIVDLATGRPIPDGFPLPPPGDIDDDDPDKYGETPEYEDSLVTAVKLAAQPNYLGSIEIVTNLVGEYFQAIIARHQKDPSGSNLEQVTTRLEKIFSGENASYTTMPSWHSDKELGVAIVKYFDLNPDYMKGENLTCCVAEGLAMVRLHLNSFLKDFDADTHAEWERDALPKLQGLHQFISAVFLGTNALAFPGKSLKDFGWST